MKIKKILAKFNEFLKIIFLVLTILGFCYAIYISFSDLKDPKQVLFNLITPFVIFLIPYLVLSLSGIRKVKAKMAVIPRFLRDIVDNIESGMDLQTAISNTKKNDYSVLDDDIFKFSNQLSWGINFETAFLNFAKNIGSEDLRKDFVLIIEARKIGGHFEKILRELSEKISLENLRKKERKTNLSSNTFTGYISFFIFIFIIILVYNNLFLGIGASLSSADLSPEDVAKANPQISIYLSLLILLSYELAILSGFLFGMMQENNVISGAPHVVSLMILTFLGFILFIQF